MPRYVIQRDIPEVGSLEREALRDAAQKSNGVLADDEGGEEEHPVGAQLRRRRQDVLHLPRRRRDAHPRACPAQRIPRLRRHRSTQDDRSITAEG